MQVSAISSGYSKPYFTSKNKGEYENPINRGTEKGLAIWGSIGGSTLVGLTAAGIGSCFIKSGAAKRALKLGGIGAAAGLATLLLTLPAKLYDTSVRAFTREKEMDVFSRDRELKSNIMEEVNKEVKDEDVDLDQKINHYTSVQMANNGNGVMIKGA
ncbi:hypothetical protein IJ541_06875 [bacterium]|nr:hypothetical protein [bacterium]